MRNKIEATIQIKGEVIDIIYEGYMISMDIDVINNTGIFEMSHLVPVQPKKVAEEDDRLH